MKQVGITTTVPLEVLLAAGWQPLDLNNILVNAPRPEKLVSIAERHGFPLNCCAWIKGIYGVCIEHGIRDVIGVSGGDCSNTIMLMEVLRLKGVNTIPFAYPARPEPALVKKALEELAAALGTTLSAAEKIRKEIQSTRDLALQLDELTWRENTASGAENHYWLVSSSYFNGDIDKYTEALAALLADAAARQSYPDNELRLGYIGVPPVYARDLHRYLERHGARVVFNEVQRQFAMPRPGANLAEQYASYTYPYSVNERLADINPELMRRRIEGVIHYVQAFCHRGIADIVFRHALEVPILTLEGNNDFSLSGHARTRLEAFLDMLEKRRAAGG